MSYEVAFRVTGSLLGALAAAPGGITLTPIHDPGLVPISVVPLFFPIWVRAALPAAIYIAHALRYGRCPNSFGKWDGALPFRPAAVFLAYAALLPPLNDHRA